MHDTGNAAEVLDAFTLWVLARVAEFPIRSSEFDEAILRAEAKGQVEALRVYRSSRSATQALEAGRDAFTLDLFTSHLAPPVPLRGEGPHEILGRRSVAVGIQSVG